MGRVEQQSPLCAFPSFFRRLCRLFPAVVLVTRVRPPDICDMDGLARKDLEDFVVRANDVTFIKLIRRESDVEDHEKDSFHPEFTHQIFGESENIFGYKDLKILIYYSSGRLKRFVSVSFKEKIPAAMSKGVEPDDLMAMIRDHIPGPFTTNLDQFTERLIDEADFRPVGEKLNQFVPTKKVTSETSEKRVSLLFQYELGRQSIPSNETTAHLRL